MNDINERIDKVKAVPNITNLVVNEILSFQTYYSNFHKLYNKKNHYGKFLFIIFVLNFLLIYFYF